MRLRLEDASIEIDIQRVPRFDAQTLGVTGTSNVMPPTVEQPRDLVSVEPPPRHLEVAV